MSLTPNTQVWTLVAAVVGCFAAEFRRMNPRCPGQWGQECIRLRFGVQQLLSLSNPCDCWPLIPRVLTGLVTFSLLSCQAIGIQMGQLFPILSSLLLDNLSRTLTKSTQYDPRHSLKRFLWKSPTAKNSVNCFLVQSSTSLRAQVRSPSYCLCCNRDDVVTRVRMTFLPAPRKALPFCLREVPYSHLLRPHQEHSWRSLRITVFDPWVTTPFGGGWKDPFTGITYRISRRLDIIRSNPED